MPAGFDHRYDRTQSARTHFVEHPTSKSDGFHPEPEIIPPDRPGGPRSHGNSHIWISVTDASGRRTYRTPGPFAVVATVVVAILAAALVLMLVLGALLIWVPIVAILLAGFLVVGFVRGYFRNYFSRPR